MDGTVHAPGSIRGSSLRASRRADDDFVNVHVCRLFDGVTHCPRDGIGCQCDFPIIGHGRLVAGSVMVLASSDSTTPGEMIVTRISFVSRRNPSEMARTANFVPL